MVLKVSHNFLVLVIASALALLLPSCNYFYNAAPLGSDVRDFGRMTFPEEGVRTEVLQQLPLGSSKEKVATTAKRQYGRKLGKGELERLRGVSREEDNALGYQLYGYGVYPLVDTQRFLVFVFDGEDALRDVYVDVRGMSW